MAHLLLICYFRFYFYSSQLALCILFICLYCLVLLPQRFVCLFYSFIFSCCLGNTVFCLFCWEYENALGQREGLGDLILPLQPGCQLHPTRSRPCCLSVHFSEGSGSDPSNTVDFTASLCAIHFLPCLGGV